MPDELTNEFSCLLNSKDPINAFEDYDKEVDQIYNVLKNSDVERQEDIPYRENGENTKIDIWGDENSDKVLIMIHGGYWLFGSRKKCLPVFKVANKLGYTVVTIGYDFTNASHLLTDTVEETLEGVRFALDRFSDTSTFVIAGHSVGAHLAFQAITKIRDPRIKAAVLVAGLYQLDELVHTDYGKDLSLQRDEAKKWNCDYSLISKNLPRTFPILLTNCKHESPKLYQQNIDFSKKVPLVTYKEYPDDDHFSILTALCEDNNQVSNDFFNFLSFV